ncbi:MAG: hypothetical protein AABZ12_07590 [Planctomycetota bacterium]
MSWTNNSEEACEPLDPAAQGSGRTRVVFARDRDEAVRYCDALSEAGILAEIGEINAVGPVRKTTIGTPVLVPDADHERASELLAGFAAETRCAWDEESDEGDDWDDEEDEEDEFFPDDADEFEDEEEDEAEEEDE